MTRSPPLFTAPLDGRIDWRAIEALGRAPEPDLVPSLLDRARLSPAQAVAAHTEAVRLANAVRQRSRESGTGGLVQGLLQEFALSSQEGVALMCLAEALLRIPDSGTRDALIRDKIGDGDWERHLGRSPSIFVNAAAWGLLVTGRLVATHSDTGLAAALRRLLARGGEPLIRTGIDRAMRMMGEQFVTGERIEEALARARRREADGFRHSYDMLGEAAATAEDATRYHAAYAQAIEAIGRDSAGRGVVEGPGISIKLSALHPRYARAQIERVRTELAPRLLALARLARGHGIGLNIDAEESDRLPVSLELLQGLCDAPDLAGWDGIGFVVQAYQKRCPAVIDAVVAMARRSGHRVMVRLVKGAYWDSEIKRAQQEGQVGYPVYTKKAHTDVAYLACARALLDAPDAVFPQFATHNAHTVAAVREMAGPRFAPGQYEYQCLHGMGEPLYEAVRDRPCRIYAPVGTHETLLAYLVRRLLENGANTSFVNRVADPALAIESLVEDPVKTVEAAARGGDGLAPASTPGDLAALLAAVPRPLGEPHALIPLPVAIHAPRVNSRGIDLAHEGTLARLAARIADEADTLHRAAPTLSAADGPWQAVLNPADPADAVGHVQEATPDDVERALAASVAAGPAGRPSDRTRGPTSSTPPPTGSTATSSASCRCSCASRERRSPTPSPRCGKRWTSCATTRPSCAAASATRRRTCRSDRSSASVRGTSRWRSSPARSRRPWPPATPCSPSPPSRRRWWRPRQSPCCMPPVCQARPCSSCRVGARRWAPPWSPTRGSRASSSPARPTSRGSCNTPWRSGSGGMAARCRWSRRRAGRTRSSSTPRPSPSRRWPTA
jgi:RHH-type proline utilization regulon transcriptional repressor/proline dehydrogenase/delta 1-pyrroline-5-carboxylate dehydrogenase